MFVNYVREINAFHRFANDNYLGSGERLLWFGLMDYINLHFASGAEWPDDWISIPNKGLLAHVPFGEDALTEARNRLKQRGLLEYTPGKRNKEAPKYRIHYFSAQLSTGSQQGVGTDCPEKPGNAPGKEGGNNPGNPPGKEGGNNPGNDPGRHPNRNLNVTPNPNVTPYEDEEEEGERARKAAYAVIDSAIKEIYGRSPNVAEAYLLAFRYECSCMRDPELLREAILEAAQHGAKNPALYAKKVLNDWCGDYICTVHDLEEWLVLKAMYEGDDCFPPGTVKYSELEAARKRRRQEAQKEREKAKQA